MQSAYKICTNPQNMQKYTLISRHFGYVYSLPDLILPNRNYVPEKNMHLHINPGSKLYIIKLFKDLKIRDFHNMSNSFKS